VSREQGQLQALRFAAAAAAEVGAAAAVLVASLIDPLMLSGSRVREVRARQKHLLKERGFAER